MVAWVVIQGAGWVGTTLRWLAVPGIDCSRWSPPQKVPSASVPVGV